ncbi:hypothetical protein ACFLZ9_02360 [Patescibacteria group bacterium]
MKARPCQVTEEIWIMPSSQAEAEELRENFGPFGHLSGKTQQQLPKAKITGFIVSRKPDGTIIITHENNKRCKKGR